MSFSDLSKGLPNSICRSLLSLRKLYMEVCQLPTLPNRCVLYYTSWSYLHHLYWVN